MATPTKPVVNPLPSNRKREAHETVEYKGRVRRMTGRGSMGSGKINEDDIRDLVLEGLTNSRKKYESNVIQESDSLATGIAGAYKLESPPYNLQALATLVDRSNILRQCIDAYVTNIESTGWTFEYIGPEGGEDSPAAVAEKERMEALLDDPNGEYSLIEMRERNRRDQESIGAYAVEVIRTPDRNIHAVYHTPSHTLFMTVRDTVATPVTRWVVRNGQYQKIVRDVRFRRFVQQVGTKKVFFKEFGDPRPISPTTGEVKADLSPAEQATEILYVPLYKSGYTYGVPRYIHQLPSITGSREAELTNLAYFKDNAIPAMAILLSGGTLTRETYEDIDQFMNRVRGREAQNKILTIEAVGDENAASDKGQLAPPKMDIKPLGHDRQQDALFQEYDKENQKKVRSAFRLNPLFIGLSEDMTYATAKASLEMSEAQVFGPERNKVDDVLNMKLLQDAEGKPPLYWWVKSNPPRLVDPQDIINSMEKFEASGAMTPNVAIGLANSLFGLEIEPIEEEWGDVPFAITKALIEQKYKIEGITIGEEPPPPEPPVVVAPGAAGGAPAKVAGKAPKAKPTAQVKPPEAQKTATRKRVRTYATTRKRVRTFAQVA